MKLPNTRSRTNVCRTASIITSQLDRLREFIDLVVGKRIALVTMICALRILAGYLTSFFLHGEGFLFVQDFFLES